MLSDNAKTFKAAGKKVKRLVHSDEVREYLSSKQVVWECIMEKAPWWGGLGADGT